MKAAEAKKRQADQARRNQPRGQNLLNSTGSEQEGRNGHADSGNARDKAAIAADMLPLLEEEARKRQGQRTDLTSVHDCTEVAPTDGPIVDERNKGRASVLWRFGRASWLDLGAFGGRGSVQPIRHRRRAPEAGAVWLR